MIYYQLITNKLIKMIIYLLLAVNLEMKLDKKNNLIVMFKENNMINLLALK